jgi:dUTPase
MQKVNIAIALSRGAEVPEYATEHAAGMDLRCAEDVQLAPMERKRVCGPA